MNSDTIRADCVLCGGKRCPTLPNASSPPSSTCMCDRCGFHFGRCRSSPTQASAALFRMFFAAAIASAVLDAGWYRISSLDGSCPSGEFDFEEQMNVDRHRRFCRGRHGALQSLPLLHVPFARATAVMCGVDAIYNSARNSCDGIGDIGCYNRYSHLNPVPSLYLAAQQRCVVPANCGPAYVLDTTTNTCINPNAATPAPTTRPSTASTISAGPPPTTTAVRLGYANCALSGHGTWNYGSNSCDCEKGWKTNVNQDTLSIAPENYTWCTLRDLDENPTEGPRDTLSGVLAFFDSLLAALTGDKSPTAWVLLFLLGISTVLIGAAVGIFVVVRKYRRYRLRKRWKERFAIKYGTSSEEEAAEAQRTRRLRGRRGSGDGSGSGSDGAARGEGEVSTKRYRRRSRRRGEGKDGNSDAEQRSVSGEGKRRRRLKDRDADTKDSEKERRRSRRKRRGSSDAEERSVGGGDGRSGRRRPRNSISTEVRLAITAALADAAGVTANAPDGHMLAITDGRSVSPTSRAMQQQHQQDTLREQMAEVANERREGGRRSHRLRREKGAHGGSLGGHRGAFRAARRHQEEALCSESESSAAFHYECGSDGRVGANGRRGRRQALTSINAPFGDLAPLSHSASMGFHSISRQSSASRRPGLIAWHGAEGADYFGATPRPLRSPAESLQSLQSARHRHNRSDFGDHINISPRLYQGPAEPFCGAESGSGAEVGADDMYSVGGLVASPPRLRRHGKAQASGSDFGAPTREPFYSRNSPQKRGASPSSRVQHSG